MSERVPYVDPEVVLHLRKVFPSVPPKLPADPNVVVQLLAMEQGVQRVINHLANLVEDQQENILNHVSEDP